MSTTKQPFFLADKLAVSGTIKARYEDFRVVEVPAYEPSGEGDHVYFAIRKGGLATMRAVGDIARALGVKPRDFGVAGQKDAHAMTEQTLSLEHADPERIAALELPRIEILWVNRHRNKLRMGHLKGNRFRIKLRETEPDRLEEVRASLQILVDHGVPNYFGPQRFGARGDTGDIGGALLRGDYAAAARLIAGRASERDTGEVLRARQLFDEAKYEEAARAWPRGHRECEVVCRGLSRWPDNPKKVVMGMDKRALGLYASAFQSMCVFR